MLSTCGPAAVQKPGLLNSVWSERVTVRCYRARCRQTPQDGPMGRPPLQISGAQGVDDSFQAAARPPSPRGHRSAVGRCRGDAARRRAPAVVDLAGQLFCVL